MRDRAACGGNQDNVELISNRIEFNFIVIANVSGSQQLNAVCIHPEVQIFFRNVQQILVINMKAIYRLKTHTVCPKQQYTIETSCSREPLGVFTVWVSRFEWLHCCQEAVLVSGRRLPQRPPVARRVKSAPCAPFRSHFLSMFFQLTFLFLFTVDQLFFMKHWITTEHTSTSFAHWGLLKCYSVQSLWSLTLQAMKMAESEEKALWSRWKKEPCSVGRRMMDDDGWRPFSKWLDDFRSRTFSSAAGWSFSLQSQITRPAWETLRVTLNLESVVVHQRLVVVVVVRNNQSETKQLFLDQRFVVLVGLTMRGAAGLAAVPALCSLVLCLCVVSQTCYGNRTSPKPDRDPRPSLPEATRPSSCHVDKQTKSPSDRSQSIRSRTLFKSRSDTLDRRYNDDNNHFPSTLSIESLNL